MIHQTKKVVDFSNQEIKECYELLLQEFAGVTWEDFVRDFKEKKYVMLLSVGEKIVGFSTLMFLDLEIHGEVVKAIFSGDTAVQREYRDSFGFAIELALFFDKAINLFPGHKIYYVLISKGWRTYRVLPFYFKEFSPKYDSSKMEIENVLVMDAFASKKYPQSYDKERGLLVFAGPTQHLKEESLDSVPPVKGSVHTDFFFKKNPDFLLGNELVCIARVCKSNFTKNIDRLISSQLKNQEV